MDLQSDATNKGAVYYWSFQNVFCPGFGAFSTFKFKVIEGTKLMLFMFQNKDKDLLGIYQYGCDPFCVSLLTDRHLKVRSNSILFTFSDKSALTSARDS